MKIDKKFRYEQEFFNMGIWNCKHRLTLDVEW